MVPVGSSFARQLRLHRLDRHGDQRLLVVPLDHSVTDGPIMASGGLGRLVEQLSEAGVDAVVLHKGTLRHLQAGWFATTSLVVHLSASTVHAPDPDAKCLVASVEEALRLGADAVSVHVNLGSREEHRQIADLGTVAEACDRWNVPLLAMMYPRGPKITDPSAPALVAHAVTLAADLGADIVKAPYAGSVDAMAEVTSGSPVPVIVAGGPPRDQAALVGYVGDAIRGGAAGVAMGRNIFQSPDPKTMAARLAALVHGGPAAVRMRGLDQLTAAAR